MKKPVNRLKRSENITGWAFITPSLLIFVCLTLLPFVVSILLSFVDWNFFGGLKKLKWVGLDNFVELFNGKDRSFLPSLQNSLVYTISIVPASIVVSLIFAYCMNGRIYGKKLLRMAFFIPYICSVVAVGSVFKFLFKEEGIINNLLLQVGWISEPIGFASDDRYTKIPVVLLSIWCSIGYQLILFTAAMQNVPTSLYEAAKIDGAGGAMQFIKITLPMISPTIFYLVITRLMAVLKIFGSVNIMTQNSQIRSMTSVVQQIYNTAFRDRKFGDGSAKAMVLFAIILLVTAINFWGQKKWVHY